MLIVVAIPVGVIFFGSPEEKNKKKNKQRLILQRGISGYCVSVFLCLGILSGKSLVHHSSLGPADLQGLMFSRADQIIHGEITSD